MSYKKRIVPKIDLSNWLQINKGHYKKNVKVVFLSTDKEGKNIARCINIPPLLHVVMKRRGAWLLIAWFLGKMKVFDSIRHVMACIRVQDSINLFCDHVKQLMTFIS